MTAVKARPEGLALLREPFPDHQISKLPKPTKKQTDDLKAATDRKDFSLGIRCALCGAWHHKDVVHLDYVGHAALTDRLLDCDPAWGWEPVAMNEQGSPLLERDGGMWIRLTVCGVTRLGYGNPDGKTGGNAVKETIGDALRNAAMRFGAALDLWHKGDLHADEDDVIGKQEGTPPEVEKQIKFESAVSLAMSALEGAANLNELRDEWAKVPSTVKTDGRVIKAKDDRKAALTKNADLDGDHIPGEGN